jgi:hypothetical protein
MATIKFFIQKKKKPATIYVRLSVSANKIFYARTKYFADPDRWSKTGPKGSEENDKILKNKLRKIENFLLEKMNDVSDINTDWLKEQLDIVQESKRVETKETNRLTNYLKDYIEKHRSVTFRTTQKFTSLLHKIEKFETHKKKTYFLENVNLNFRDNFLEYLLDIDKLNISTAGSYMNHLKTLCLDAQKHGFRMSPEMTLIKRYAKRSNKPYLSFNELEKIEKMHFERESLENAKKWLIIGCYIGQRVSDLLRIVSIR